jgi:hypothetical protein
MFSIQMFFLSFPWFITSTTASIPCDYYLAPSLYLSGIGVYAGRSYDVGETSEDMITISCEINEYPRMIRNYDYKSKVIEEQSLITFGTSMMCNHIQDNNLRHVASRAADFHQTEDQIRIYQTIEAHSVHFPSYFETIKPIGPGEEMTANYGAEWFSLRDIEYIEPSASNKLTYTLQDLKQVGQCISHLYIDESDIPLAGKGVFAKRKFSAGEILSVTPVLIHSVHEAAETSGRHSVFLNYILAAPGSDVGLISIGIVGMCNNGGESANSEMEWFNWPGLNTTSAADLNPHELLRASSAQLYLAYRANRDINEGEEVTIDYGESWEQDWERYVEDKRSFKMFEREIPLFRRPIEVPGDLYPQSWYIDCIGVGCEDSAHGEEL